MVQNPAHRRSRNAADACELGVDAKVAPVRIEAVERDHLAIISSLMVQLSRYETAVDSISQGICFYDGDKRLILSNQRYAEIYHLNPAVLLPGLMLREVVELRYNAGTCPSEMIDDYLAWCEAVNVATGPRTWNAQLKDGRSIRVCHKPLSDGGWVSTHEDVSAEIANAILTNERLSLQILIDAVPDYLWVKDRESRFIVANKALAAD